MQDLVQKIDRAKAILEPALAPSGDQRTAKEKEADATELLMIGVDLFGETFANLRRIAVALERIAADKDPVNVKADSPGFRPLAAKD